MTHARMPPDTPRDPQGNAEDLAGRRRFAEMIELPAACPHRSCTGGRCRGPRGASETFPEAAMPECLATFLDELHAPVRLWGEFWERIAESLARLEAAQAKLDGKASPGPRARA
jgi:hypothetical protein